MQARADADFRMLTNMSGKQSEQSIPLLTHKVGQFLRVAILSDRVQYIHNIKISLYVDLMNQPSISFEFFPPRNDAMRRRFWHTLGRLETLNPAYISVTWGALGSNSQASLDVLEHLVKDSSAPVVAHLSCAGQTKEQMAAMIRRVEELGIRRFLALRGDQAHQKGSGKSGLQGLLRHASELVGMLAEDESRDITVAAYPEKHPESESLASDIKWLKHKLDAGASRAITQYFFEAETFLRFRDKAVSAGINKPLVPGILPIHDIDKVADFSARCDASVPENLIKRFSTATTPEAKFEMGVEQCVELCSSLRREGVDEFHLYTLNQWPLTAAVTTELRGKTASDSAAA